MNADKESAMSKTNLVSDLNDLNLKDAKMELSEILTPLKTLNTHLKHNVDKLVVATKHVLEDADPNKVLLEVELELKVLFDDVEKLLCALEGFQKIELLSVSQVYRKRFIKSVSRVVEAVKIVLNSVKTMRGGSDQNLNKLVGRVWETCDSLDALPLNEVVVVVEYLENEQVMVEDALVELQEEEEEEFKVAIKGLVKVGAVCLKKVAQCIKKNGKLRDLDDFDRFLSDCGKISPIVDNLCSTDDATEVAKEAEELRDTLNSILTLVEPLDKSNAFVAFLRRALTHNYDKVLTGINEKT